MFLSSRKAKVLSVLWVMLVVAGCSGGQLPSSEATLFSIMDVDGSGQVSSNELANVYFQQLHIVADRNGDNRINRREHEIAVDQARQRLPVLTVINLDFARFNTNGDLFISAFELASSSVAQDVIDQADVNANGLMDFNEFSRVFF